MEEMNVMIPQIDQQRQKELYLSRIFYTMSRLEESLGCDSLSPYLDKIDKKNIEDAVILFKSLNEYIKKFNVLN